MSSLNIVLIGICVLVTTFAPAFSQQINFGRECVTPQGVNGFCVDILQCSSLVYLVQNSVGNVNNRNYLISSRCSGAGANVIACCPATELKVTIDRIGDSLLPSREVCGQQSAKRILNGMITKTDEFPWTVQLWYANLAWNRQTTVCAGVLINADHVVTAAHCVNSLLLGSKRLRLEKVRLGEWNTSSVYDCNEPGDCANPVEDIPVAQVFEHENYDPRSPSKENDIAVIRLARKVSYSDFIRPICLPIGELANKDFGGVDLTAAGWGRTETAAKSDVKLKVTLRGVDSPYCASVYRPSQVIVGTRHLCAGGERGSDTCSGDSGAPLMGFDESNRLRQFWYLAGVVSFGPEECGTEGLPGVYVRVNQLTDWIISKLQ